MKTKHEIEIEGLPEGWKPVAFRHACAGDTVFASGIVTTLTRDCCMYPILIVEKIQPRRVVLEETEEDNVYGKFYLMANKDLKISVRGDKIWREVKEGE